jgi:acyl carrier protein
MRRAVSARSLFQRAATPRFIGTVFAQGTYTSVRSGARCIRFDCNAQLHRRTFLDTSQQVVSLLGSVLNLGEERARRLTPESPLLGAIPELDSMAVVLLLTAIEEKFGFSIDDDEVDAMTFATLSHLVGFVVRKCGQRRLFGN